MGTRPGAPPRSHPSCIRARSHAGRYRSDIACEEPRRCLMRSVRMAGVVLVMVAAAAPAFGATAAAAPTKTRTLNVVINTRGTEYEDANGTVINGSDATACPPTRDNPD